MVDGVRERKGTGFGDEWAKQLGGCWVVSREDPPTGAGLELLRCGAVREWGMQLICCGCWNWVCRGDWDSLSTAISGFFTPL